MSPIRRRSEPDMKIAPASAPEGGHRLVERALQDVLPYGDDAKGGRQTSSVDEIEISQPIPIYRLGLDRLQSAGNVEDADLVGWRYLVRTEPGKFGGRRPDRRGGQEGPLFELFGEFELGPVHASAARRTGRSGEITLHAGNSIYRYPFSLCLGDMDDDATGGVCSIHRAERLSVRAPLDRP